LIKICDLGGANTSKCEVKLFNCKRKAAESRAEDKTATVLLWTQIGAMEWTKKELGRFIHKAWQLYLSPCVRSVDVDGGLV